MYISLVPAWVCGALLLAAWVTFAYQTYHRIEFGRYFVVGLLAALTLQIIAAASTAIATIQNPISAFACWMGILGALGYPLIVLAEVAVLVFLFRIGRQHNGDRKTRFGAWLSIWFILNLVAFLAHVRSAALCTV